LPESAPGMKLAHLSEDGEALSMTALQCRIEPFAPAWGFPGAVAQGSSGDWFAVYTASRHEKSVSRHLDARGIANFLPTYCSERKWRNGQKVGLDLPLLPNYIFVQFKPGEYVQVLDVPGALSIVCGTGGEFAALPGREIDLLRSSLAKCSAEPHPLVKVGEKVRIRRGAMAGMEGVVVRVRGALRVVITVEMLMRSFSVELGSDELEFAEA